MYVCMFQHNSGTPGAISTKTLYTYDSIYIYIKYKNGCMYVCTFHHNSGTPGAISTKLRTHMNIYIILYI
jgi:hypothetical protein